MSISKGFNMTITRARLILQLHKIHAQNQVPVAFKDHALASMPLGRYSPCMSKERSLSSCTRAASRKSSGDRLARVRGYVRLSREGIAKTGAASSGRISAWPSSASDGSSSGRATQALIIAASCNPSSCMHAQSSTVTHRQGAALSVLDFRHSNNYYYYH